MSYRKMINLKPATGEKLEEAAKRHGVNRNEVIDLAVDLLDRIDHARHKDPIVSITVQTQNGVDQVPLYFRG
ncbi:MAG: hypothetical protein AB7T86_04935 [Xanthobacteraceae bacterium]